MAFVDCEETFDFVKVAAVLEATCKQGVEDVVYRRSWGDTNEDGTATIKNHAKRGLGGAVPFHLNFTA